MADSPYIIEEIRLSGFDPDGEPTVRVMSDGSLRVVFEFMPPSWAEDAELEGFDNQLAEATGVAVLREDREILVIVKPRPDTIAKIRTFVKGYRKNWKQRHKKPSMRERILEGLRDVFAAGGFRLNQSKATFRRRIPGGWQEAGLAFWNYHPLYKFALYAEVHLDAVNDILNPFQGMEPKYWKDSPTTIAQMEYFTDGMRGDFPVSSDEELAAALSDVATLVREKMIPFFDEHRDLAALDRSLHAPITAPNYQPPAGHDARVTRRTINGMNVEHRCLSGIIIAHLAGNPNFDKIVTHYRKEMGLPPEHADNKCSRLVSLLRTGAKT